MNGPRIDISPVEGNWLPRSLADGRRSFDDIRGQNDFRPINNPRPQTSHINSREHVRYGEYRPQSSYASRNAETSSTSRTSPTHNQSRTPSQRRSHTTIRSAWYGHSTPISTSDQPTRPGNQQRSLTSQTTTASKQPRNFTYPVKTILHTTSKSVLLENIPRKKSTH